jgi:hypothetical protein
VTQSVPSDEGLRHFAPDAATARFRSITVDRDWDLSAEERKRLENARVPVRWIHAAPMGLILSRERGFGRAMAPYLR